MENYYIFNPKSEGKNFPVNMIIYYTPGSEKPTDPLIH